MKSFLKTYSYFMIGVIILTILTNFGFYSMGSSSTNKAERTKEHERNILINKQNKEEVTKEEIVILNRTYNNYLNLKKIIDFEKDRWDKLEELNKYHKEMATDFLVNKINSYVLHYNSLIEIHLPEDYPEKNGLPKKLERIKKDDYIK